MSKSGNSGGGKGGSGGRGPTSPSRPGGNWSSQTGNPSGSGRGNAFPSKDK